MKKLLVGLCAVFICTFAIAHTIEWYDDDNLLSTTTCSSGDNITPPTAPAKYGYTLNGWITSQYTKLEYIQSTGTQYIDTGIKSTANELQITFKMQSLVSQYEAFFGAVTETNVRNGIRLFRQDDNSLLHFQAGYNPDMQGVTTLIRVPDNREVLDVTMQLTNGGNGIVIINNDTKSVSNVNITNNDQDILIFSSNIDTASPSGTGSFKLWSFQIIKDDVLVFNGIPAKNLLGVVGMYDKVSGQFFTNAGTGEFIAGPEVGDL